MGGGKGVTSSTHSHVLVHTAYYLHLQGRWRYTVHILPVEYDTTTQHIFLIIQSPVTVGVNYNVFHSLT